jgi:hypothetical protein
VTKSSIVSKKLHTGKIIRSCSASIIAPWWAKVETKVVEDTLEVHATWEETEWPVAKTIPAAVTRRKTRALKSTRKAASSRGA